MLRTSPRARSGMSLVEVMVSVVIFTAIGAGLFGILQIGTTIYMRDSALLDLQQSVRNAMERIVREVRESGGSSITTVNDDADTISFNTPNETSIQYYLNGTNLIREYPSGTQTIVTTQISRLKFTKSSTLLTIDIEAAQTLYGEEYNFSLRENVRLRNE